MNYKSISILRMFSNLPYNNHRGYDDKDDCDDGGEADDENLSPAEHWLAGGEINVVVVVFADVTRVVEIADIVVCCQ